MKEEKQDKAAEQTDKPKKAVPKPSGKNFGRRGYEKQKGGLK